MTPLEALNRVVYLLDRSLAEPNKVQRLPQRRRRSWPSCPTGEIEARAAAGTLTDLPGIGKSTGAVIAEAFAGEVPERIVDLEASTVVPLGDGGAPYRAALKGDCHSHCFWSDGSALRSSRWPAPPWSSATTTSCSPTTRPG